MWNKFFNRIWSFLPDKCMAKDCKRTGVRGNENMYGDFMYCDDCHAKLQRSFEDRLDSWCKFLGKDQTNEH